MFFSSNLFSNNLFSLGFEPVQNDFQHDFTWMTDEAHGSVILAELSESVMISDRVHMVGLFPVF